MARQRRGGFRPPELRGTLGTLLRTTLEQAGVVRDAISRGARSRFDEARSHRRRQDALASLGELVLDLIRRGEIDLAELPEARDIIQHLDDLDADAGPPDPDDRIAQPPTRGRFDARPPVRPRHDDDANEARHPMRPRHDDDASEGEGYGYGRGRIEDGHARARARAPRAADDAVGASAGAGPGRDRRPAIDGYDDDGYDRSRPAAPRDDGTVSAIRDGDRSGPGARSGPGDRSGPRSGSGRWAAPKPASSQRVWRPSIPDAPDAPDAEPHAEPASPRSAGSAGSARRPPPDPHRKGGIHFDGDDEDLADYMHPDDVPPKPRDDDER